ncbi:MAG: hypothetical protein JNM31_12160 [Flavobacteriales bacterium]|nr:hypothetical protein [Flavobacteriales bacterium]
MSSDWIRVLVFSLLFAGVGFILGRVTCGDCCGSEGRCGGAAMACAPGHCSSASCHSGQGHCSKDKACCRKDGKHGDHAAAADTSGAH